MSKNILNTRFNSALDLSNSFSCKSQLRVLTPPSRGRSSLYEQKKNVHTKVREKRASKKDSRLRLRRKVD